MILLHLYTLNLKGINNLQNKLYQMERRQFLRLAGLASVSSLITPAVIGGIKSNTEVSSIHIFNNLPYAYNALEPYIDAETMELHYSKHHKGYYNKFMAAAKKFSLEHTTMKDIFANIDKYDLSVKNNGGGYYNHSLFWKNLSPNGGSPSKQLIKDIESTFDSFENFQSIFFKAAKGQFGSGWAWLVLDKNNKLQIGNTPNQDNPLMPQSDIQGTPLIAFDVWEHAYYLKYQNKRGDYINAFWNIINWNEVNDRYHKALQ